MHVDWDSDSGIKMRRVPSEHFVKSIDFEKSRDGRGCYYFGEVRTMTVGEISKMAGGRLTKRQLNQLSGTSQGTYSSFEDFSSSELEASVQILQFCYKTTRDRIYKKKGNKHGNESVIRKEDDWRPPKDSRAIMLNSPYEVWYEGIYVTGTDILLRYELMDNMLRDPKDHRKALPPYVTYKLSTEPIGSKIKSICDDIYIIKIKLRQLVMKLRPHGIAIDVDGLDDMEEQGFSAIDQIKLFNEDGNLVYSGANLVDDSGNFRPPVHALPANNANEIRELLELHNMHIRRMHEVTGINPQATGAAPPSRTSKDVYQGTIASSQTVVNNIFNAHLSIQQRVSEAIVSRLQSASKHNESKKLIESILGEYTTDVIGELADIKRYQYVLNIDIKPTDEERAKLVEDLTLALQTGMISLPDKMDIQSIDNIKLAHQMIKIRMKENIARNEMIKEEESRRAVEQINAAKQSEFEKAQMEAQLKIQEKMAETEAKAKLEAFKAKNRLREISHTKSWDLEIAKVTTGAKIENEKFKEDRKDDRTKIQADQQSELIDQRQNKTGVKKFKEPEIPEVAPMPSINQ
jgi:hypothetical protein